MNVSHSENLGLPLRDSPLRFAVMMPDGRTSNSWRVWTEGGDGYICCRDNMKEVKVSLHGSGKQHIAFRQESGIEMTPGSRFWNEWREPQQGSPAIPTFKLIFPPWGVRLARSDRTKTTAIRQKWSENHVLIEGHGELLTVVSFVILDEETNLNFIGDYPHVLLAVLPHRDGKSLFVVAGREPSRNFKSVVEEALAKIGPEIANNLSTPCEGEDPLLVCLTGENPDGYAFMVSVPVEPTPASQPERPSGKDRRAN